MKECRRDACARQSRAACILECERDSEVRDQRMAALQQNVLRLHIAMHDAAAVRVIECVRHLAHQHERVVEWESTLAGEP